MKRYHHPHFTETEAKTSYGPSLAQWGLRHSRPSHQGQDPWPRRPAGHSASAVAPAETACPEQTGRSSNLAWPFSTAFLRRVQVLPRRCQGSRGTTLASEKPHGPKSTASCHLLAAGGQASGLIVSIFKNGASLFDFVFQGR